MWDSLSKPGKINFYIGLQNRCIDLRSCHQPSHCSYKKIYIWKKVYFVDIKLCWHRTDMRLVVFDKRKLWSKHFKSSANVVWSGHWSHKGQCWNYFNIEFSFYIHIIQLAPLRMRLSFSLISQPRMHQLWKYLWPLSRGGPEDSKTPPTCKVWMIWSEVMALPKSIDLR